jgi:hypothetical protein
MADLRRRARQQADEGFVVFGSSGALVATS